MVLLDDNSVLVEDLSFLYDPDHFSWIHRMNLNRKHKKNIKKATRVMAVSDEVAYQVHKYYKVPLEKIEVFRKVRP